MLVYYYYLFSDGILLQITVTELYLNPFKNKVYLFQSKMIMFYWEDSELCLFFFRPKNKNKFHTLHIFLKKSFMSKSGDNYAINIKIMRI